MKVKIIKATSPDAWYADKIGKMYDVDEEAFIMSDGIKLHRVSFSDNWVRDDDFLEVLSPISNGDPTYLQLLEDMKSLHIKKNAGYSGDSQDRWANFRLAETLGVSTFLGVMVRMSDKWIRITNLVKNPSFDKVGEAIEDTLMDLASYALIAICILKEKNNE